MIKQISFLVENSFEFDYNANHDHFMVFNWIVES